MSDTTLENTQGMLNRIRGSVTFATASQLNVTSDYLAPEGIVVSYNSPLTTQLETMTGHISVPAAKQDVKIDIHLNRAQGLAETYRQQIAKNVIVGLVTVQPDSPVLSDIVVRNCAIIGQSQEAQNGTQSDWTITLQGYMLVNTEVWDAA